MSNALRLTVLQGSEEVLGIETWDPIIVGRQTGSDQKPPSHRQREKKCRVVIAGRDNKVVSREHVLIESMEGNRVKVTNVSQRYGVQLPNQTTLNSQEVQELSLPVSLGVASFVLRVEEQGTESAPLRALELAPPTPQVAVNQRNAFASRPVFEEGEKSSEFYLRVLELSLNRLQGSVDQKSMWDQATHCAAELLELDSVWLFLLNAGEWVIKAWSRRGSLTREQAGEASKFILGKVREEKRTFWLKSQAVGIAVLPSVAAAPILDSQGAVIGALYGQRMTSEESATIPFNRMLAASVELIASAVASLQVRGQQRAEASSGGPQSEFFSPQVAKRVFDAPHLLEEREVEIALLECEIRDFDAIIAQVGHSAAAARLQEIFDPISESILETQGVLGEFKDASLRAFWGAPMPLSEIADQAARGAMAILQRTNDLGVRWSNDLGRPLELGLVLHMGTFSLGRRGSRFRFKYGPWAAAWETNEKMQQVSRVLRTPLLISKAARALLPYAFTGRRLGRLEAAGWDSPMELFELVETASKTYGIRGSYEEALACFERGDFETATQRVGKILADHPNDVPAYLLQMRAIQAKLNKGAAASGVLKLSDTGV